METMGKNKKNNKIMNINNGSKMNNGDLKQSNSNVGKSARIFLATRNGKSLYFFAILRVRRLSKSIRRLSLLVRRLSISIRRLSK